MLTKELHTKRPWPFLIVSVTAFLILGFDQLLRFNYLRGVRFRFEFSEFTEGTLLALFFFGAFMFARDYFDKKEIFSVRILLRTSMFLGLGTLVLYYLLQKIPAIYLGIAHDMTDIRNLKVIPTSPVLDYVVEFLKPLVIVYYLAISLVLFKKLIFFKKTKWDIIWWNLLQAILFVSLIFSYNWNLHVIIYYTVLGIGGALVLMLSVRLKWIAFLNTQDKMQSILYFALITLITYFVLQNFFSANDSNILRTDFQSNTFVMIIGFAVMLYSAFSILALIFNLPTSTVAEQKNLEIDSFHELSRFHTNMDSEELFDKLFKIALESSLVEGAFFLINDPKGKYRYYATHNLKGEQVKYLKSYCRSEAREFKEQRLYLNNEYDVEVFNEIRTEFESVFYHPLMLDGRKIGDLFLLKTFDNGFDEYMIRMIKTYSDQTIMSLHNFELLEDTLEATRLKGEMEIARTVQQKILPKDLPKNEDFEVDAFYLSAQEVGGDYYDFAQEGNRYKFMIADVSGKGTNAAFHVAEMKGVFQALIHQNLDEKEFVAAVNKSISNCFDKGTFITAAYITIDTEKKTFKHIRAGHCPTIFVKNGGKDIEFLEGKGLAFGVLRNDSYGKHIEIEERSYQPGDVLFMYTDGMMEARSADTDEEFGMERLKNLVEEYKNLNTKDILDNIIQVLTVFTEGKMSFDDTTLMALKFK